ncbi:MAG: helix-turn-helix domain-containing protein [Actinomycetota bacterium]
MVVRNTLKDFITNRGLNVYQFCKQTGITKATAYRLCRNQEDIPSGKAMDIICKVYGVKPGDLLHYEPDPEDW